jgi:predicted acetyltransferase
MNESLHLITPAVALEAEYRAFTAEFRTREELHIYAREAGEDFAAFVAQLARESRGEGVPDWWVPQHTFWLVRDGVRLLGQIRLRHYLTPPLEDFGGHIGYAVRPSEWGKGYGTVMLQRVLDHARQLGLARILLTCDTANVASARVMEKNGGVLASEGISPLDGQPTRRYWIVL